MDIIRWSIVRRCRLISFMLFIFFLADCYDGLISLVVFKHEISCRRMKCLEMFQVLDIICSKYNGYEYIKNKIFLK